MSTTYGNAADAYKRNAILTASPEKLVVMLYDGAIQHLERARIDLATPGKTHSPSVGIHLGKAMAIIGELRTTLDHEKGGEVAGNLDRLYDFCLDRIYETNVERRPEPIDGTLGVMKTLKEAWDAIVPA